MAYSVIGILHPGEMGAGIAAELACAKRTLCWASSGRAAASARRAEAAGLVDLTTISELTKSCELVISVCPPGAALEVARQVQGFTGLYLDANAISRATAREVAAVIESGGGRFVDASIIGSPPGGAGSTALYLSGALAAEASEIFAGTKIEVTVLPGGIGAASALKMCFAAWTKGTAALLLAVRALALAEGVDEPLLERWQSSHPGLVAQGLRAAEQAATRGWRWVGEMEEIASAFGSAGLPAGFHLAAAEIYSRPRRDEHARADAATLSQVLSFLVNVEGKTGTAGPLSSPPRAAGRARGDLET